MSLGKIRKKGVYLSLGAATFLLSVILSPFSVTDSQDALSTARAEHPDPDPDPGPSPDCPSSDPACDPF